MCHAMIDDWPSSLDGYRNPPQPPFDCGRLDGFLNPCGLTKLALCIAKKTLTTQSRSS